MRIDSHHSFSERYSLAYLETILKRNRFDGSVVVAQASLPVSVSGAGFHPAADFQSAFLTSAPCPQPATTFESVSPFPDFVKGLVVMLDVRDPNLPYLLDAYQRDPRFKGVCHHFTGEIPEALSELERRNIPLDAIAPPSQIPRIATRFPNLRIVIDHVGQVLDLPSHQSPQALADQWAQDLAQAAQFPQVFCKLSAVARLSPSPRPCVQHALSVFGPRRLMFGSDWPEGLPDTTWKASLAAFTQAIGPQTIEVREELLGGTAERFYGL